MSVSGVGGGQPILPSGTGGPTADELIQQAQQILTSGAPPMERLEQLAQLMQRVQQLTLTDADRTRVNEAVSRASCDAYGEIVNPIKFSYLWSDPPDRLLQHLATVRALQESMDTLGFTEHDRAVFKQDLSGVADQLQQTIVGDLQQLIYGKPDASPREWLDRLQQAQRLLAGNPDLPPEALNQLRSLLSQNTATAVRTLIGQLSDQIRKGSAQDLPKLLTEAVNLRHQLSQLALTPEGLQECRGAADNLFREILYKVPQPYTSWPPLYTALAAVTRVLNETGVAPEVQRQWLQDSLTQIDKVAPPLQAVLLDLQRQLLSEIKP
jgi:hypothetical protein